MMDIISNPQMLADFLATSLRLSVPIVFAALGGVLAERSGVFNIGLEGMILAGAFGAAVGAFFSGSPFGAGGMLFSTNSPSRSLSEARSLSPCITRILTADWLSRVVVNTWAFITGTVELRGISLAKCPSKVAIPSDSGVTSSSSTPLFSSVSTLPWMQAPTATTSSGFTPLWGSLPNRSRTSSWTLGIRVWPPTRITSSICLAVTPASFIACRQGSAVRSMRSMTRDSSLARVSVITRCLGPLASAVMNGRLISVWSVVDSSILAFSAASFSRWRAIRSFRRSMPCSLRYSSPIHSMTFWSKSSPPRCVSPFVALTSKTPSPISRIETSKVPPPRS